MAEKKIVETFVIIENVTGTPKYLSDHKGGQRMLAPAGSRTSITKIMLEERGREAAIAKYQGLMRKDRDFRITFSGDISNVPRKSPLTVTSATQTTEEVNKKVDFLRQQQKEKATKDRENQARLVREKAKASLSRKNKEEAGERNEDLDTEEATKDRDTEEAPPPEEITGKAEPGKPTRKAKELKASEESTVEEVPDEEAGIPINKENLEAMSTVDLMDVAKNLELDIQRGAAKADIVKAILVKVGV